MAVLSQSDINVLAFHSRLGATLDEALTELPTRVDRRKAKRLLDSRGIRFRREKQRLRPGQWVASACRSYHPDPMDARQSNRERARVRYRVTQMGMPIDEAVRTPAMTPAEKGRLGALKRWGKPLVVERGNQLCWQWL